MTSSALPSAQQISLFSLSLLAKWAVIILVTQNLPHFACQIFGKSLERLIPGGGCNYLGLRILAVASSHFLSLNLAYFLQRELKIVVMLRSLYCKKTAGNFSPIILSRNLGTSLRQNHKKNWWSPALIWRYDFLKFNMGSYGNFYFVAV
jgi:hypothetical protein